MRADKSAKNGTRHFCVDNLWQAKQLDTWPGDTVFVADNLSLLRCDLDGQLKPDNIPNTAGGAQ